MEYSNNPRRYYGENSGSYVAAWGTAGSWLALIFAILAFTFAEMAWKNGAEVAEANAALVSAVNTVKSLEYTLLGNTANVTLDSTCNDLNECTADFKDRTGNCVYRNKPTTFACTVNPCNASCVAGVCTLASGTCSGGKCAGGSCVGKCVTGTATTCPNVAGMGVYEIDGATSLLNAPSCTESSCVYISTVLTIANIPGYGATTAITTTPGMTSTLKDYCTQLVLGTPYGSCLYADWLPVASSTSTFTCQYQFSCARDVGNGA